MLVIVTQWLCFLSHTRPPKQCVRFPSDDDSKYASNPPFSIPVGRTNGKGRKTERDGVKESARFAVEVWTRWRKKLVVAKQARAFSPSRSLIAWIVLTMPPLQFPPLPPRCITLGIYSSICRHLAKYRLGGWSFLGTTGPTSAVEWIWPGTIGETERARGWEIGALNGGGKGITAHISIGPWDNGASIEPASSDRPWRAAQETRPSHPLRLARIYASDAPNSVLRFAQARHHLRERFQLTMTDWKKESVTSQIELQ